MTLPSHLRGLLPLFGSTQKANVGNPVFFGAPVKAQIEYIPSQINLNLFRERR
jgi:hypothetical protein